ncbi:protein kinase [Nocardiopsis sp. RSe5-2]|uniref:non-specific serine/threonine protein kinase n=1 Tax=Nocardiopsis endophytica TaxID=3018445 RepID=A0ABT4U9R4_9ACTN|nr:protein kinase [Nocardiopsis endophytica]MDA2813087.1 protein kinase [Nocardiopsis endophytica]
MSAQMSGDAPQAVRVPGFREPVLAYRGRQAQVFKAVSERTGAAVALKAMHGAGGYEEITRLRDLGGARGVVPLLDVARAQTGEPVLVMPFQPDGSYADILARSGPVDLPEAVRAGRAAAGALAALHGAGMLHNDVVPSNLLRSGTSAVLTDFGSAAPFGSPAPRLRTSSELVFHAPPEVLRGQRTGPASDVYQLASSLWTVIAGRVPFADWDGGRPDPKEYARTALREPPPDLPLPGVPGPVNALLVGAMAKDPAARPATPAEFEEELGRLWAAVGTSYGSVTPSGGTPPPPPASAPPPEASVTREPLWPSGPQAEPSPAPSRVEPPAPTPAPRPEAQSSEPQAAPFAAPSRAESSAPASPRPEARPSESQVPSSAAPSRAEPPAPTPLPRPEARPSEPQSSPSAETPPRPSKDESDAATPPKGKAAASDVAAPSGPAVIDIGLTGEFRRKGPTRPTRKVGRRPKSKPIPGLDAPAVNEAAPQPPAPEGPAAVPAAPSVPPAPSAPPAPTAPPAPAVPFDKARDLYSRQAWQRLKGWTGGPDTAPLPGAGGRDAGAVHASTDPDDFEGYEHPTGPVRAPRWRRHMHIGAAAASVVVLASLLGAGSVARPGPGFTAVGAETARAAAGSGGGEPQDGKDEKKDTEADGGTNGKDAPGAPEPPTGVSLEDGLTTVEVTWQDASGGTARYFVVGGAEGSPPATLARTGPGVTSAQVPTESGTAEYCFTVVAVDGGSAAADEACTDRAGARAQAEAEQQRQEEEEAAKEEEEKKEAEEQEREQKEAGSQGGTSSGIGSGGTGSDSSSDGS